MESIPDKKELRTDKSWSEIENLMCKVESFTALSGSVENGEVKATNLTEPYGALSLDCQEKMSAKFTGMITHKIDFLNVWNVFNIRGVKSDEEVYIVWTKKQYRGGLIVRTFSKILPKIIILIFKNDGYKILHDNNYKPKLTGEARFIASKPVETIKPDIMQ